MFLWICKIHILAPIAFEGMSRYIKSKNYQVWTWFGSPFNWKCISLQRASYIFDIPLFIALIENSA